MQPHEIDITSCCHREIERDIKTDVDLDKFDILNLLYSLELSLAKTQQSVDGWQYIPFSHLTFYKIPYMS